MKFHPCSDIHLDINDYNCNKNESYLQLIPGVFNLVAGDISGYPEFRDEWIKDQIERGCEGCFIEGNHVIYNRTRLPYKTQLSNISKKYSTTKLKFLDNNTMYLPAEDIVVFGATLWTDQNLNNNIHYDGKIAEEYMNDYRFPAFTRAGALRRAAYTDFIRQHKTTLTKLETALSEHPTSKFVVVTHHAPSRKSIDIKYKDSVINASYASNLDDFIISHPQIKLWVHGHIHSPSDYMIGDCRVICNPLGYVKYNESCGFDENLIVEI